MRGQALAGLADQRHALADLLAEVEIRPLISLAASADRWARARTSWATTAKPRPASPARAASTPAFRASRLVWKAISSITPMIWLISVDDFSIWPMAAMARCTTSPDASASLRAEATACAACWEPDGRAFDGHRDLFERRGGLFQRGGLLFRAFGEVIRAGRSPPSRCGSNPSSRGPNPWSGPTGPPRG